MLEGDSNNPIENAIDTAAQITDNVMTSVAEVVKGAVSGDNSNLETQPIDVDAIVLEGEAAHRSGEHETALVLFNKAIALDPSNAMAWFNRGVLLEAQQDTKGARQSFVICLDLDQNHGPALANLAVLLDRVGESDGAAEIADRALMHYPGHPSLLTILEAAKAAGGIVPDTPKIMPHATDTVVDATIHHVTTEKMEKSIPISTHEDIASDNLLEMVNPEPIPEVIVLEPVLEPEQELIEHELVETVSVEINLDNLCEDAMNLLTTGDAKGALSLLKEHLHGPAATHFDSWKISAGAMASLGLDDHAIEAYNHAIGLNEEDAKCFFNLGALHQRKENLDAAIKCFKGAVERDGTYTKATERIAEIAEIIGDVESLINARRLLANTSENGGEKLANLLVELAEGEAKILENSVGLPPTIPAGPELASEALNHLTTNSELRGRALTASGQHTESVLCWKAIIQEDKSNPDLWSGLARALEAAGDMTTAQRCHEKSFNLRNGVVPESSQPSFPPQESQEIPEAVPEPVVQENLPELTPREEEVVVSSESNPEVDLAAAALEASSRVEENYSMNANSKAIANQDIEWYNKGVGLIEDKKYREALSCFDRALPSFADNDEMVIRILNGRGNALYYLEEYPKCVESYHKAMVINPSGVQGKTLYNMGTAYAEMQRFADAIKCFEQAVPRGLDNDQQKLAKEQIRRCNILLKEQQ